MYRENVFVAIYIYSRKEQNELWSFTEEIVVAANALLD